MKIKLCDDCNNNHHGECAVDYTDPVTGKVTRHSCSCQPARRDPFHCGPDARYFEPIPIPKPTNILHLYVAEDGWLWIEAGEDVIGSITAEGSCQILSSDNTVRAFAAWRKDDHVICHDSIEWRGGRYQLTATTLQRVDLAFGKIYNFDACCPCPNCKDGNIVRHDNGTPVLF